MSNFEATLWAVWFIGWMVSWPIFLENMHAHDPKNPPLILAIVLCMIGAAIPLTWLAVPGSFADGKETRRLNRTGRLERLERVGRVGLGGFVQNANIRAEPTRRRDPEGNAP